MGCCSNRGLVARGLGVGVGAKVVYQLFLGKEVKTSPTALTRGNGLFPKVLWGFLPEHLILCFVTEASLASKSSCRRRVCK